MHYFDVFCKFNIMFIFELLRLSYDTFQRNNFWEKLSYVKNKESGNLILKSSDFPILNQDLIIQCICKWNLSENSAVWMPMRCALNFIKHSEIVFGIKWKLKVKSIKKAPNY